jgi:hypothetical protein
LNASVWGLDTGRLGEFMQVELLGRRLGLRFERVRLSPAGAPLTPLPALPPRLILSFGRAAHVARQIAASFQPRPLLVHLGTPGQTPIDAFDLVIPMPQDDYPPAPNVVFLNLPLNGASLDVCAIPAAVNTGICTLIVGGPSRHFRLPRRAIHGLVQFGAGLALANNEALQVVTSPRTPEPALTELRNSSTRSGFSLHEYGATNFANILQSGSRFVVTADSASMLGQACRSGAPVWLFPLPARRNVSNILQHAADHALGPRFRHRFVRRGWIGGGTDFAAWHRRLERGGYIRIAGDSAVALDWRPTDARPDTDLRDCQARILAMLE